MKIALGMLFGVLLSPVVFADGGQCAESICVGNTVIDGNNAVGTVVAVDETTVTVSIDGTNYSYDASQLSLETPAIGGLSAGQLVVDPNNAIGKVSLTFANGVVQYLASGNYYFGTDTTLVPSVTTYGGLIAGETILDANNAQGSIVDLFADGRIEYAVNGNSYFATAGQLTPETSSEGVLKDGMTVVDSNNAVGTVSHLYTDGRVEYQVNGNFYYGTVSQLVPLVTSVPSAPDLIAGKTVADSNNAIGTVNRVFADGRVEYSVSGNYYFGTVSQLSLSVPSVSSAPDITTLKVVIDSNNAIGTVSQVFADGRVQYLVNGSYYFSTVQFLSPQVDSNPKYSTGVLYADDDYDVGQPTLFFKDGRMQVSTVDDFNEIETVLYPEAPIANYSAGTQVVLPSGAMGTVSKTFLNDTVLYSYANGNALAQTGAQIFGADSANLQSEEEAWIQLLANSIESPGEPSFSPGIVDRSADYPSLKAKLLVLVKAQPQLVADPALRAKVIAALSE